MRPSLGVAKRAFALIQMGRPELALEALEAAITRWPEQSELYLVATHAYWKLERDDEAEAAARRVIALRPDDGASYRCLVPVLILANKPQEAVDYALRALRLKPLDQTTLCLLSGAYRLCGARAQALEYAKRCISLRPEVGYQRVGEALLAYGRWEEAEEALRTVFAERPTFTDIPRSIALSLIPRGRVAEAVEELEASLRNNPKDKFNLLLWDRLHEWQETEASLRRAIATIPECEPIAQLASLFIAQDRLREAVEALESLLRLDPDNDFGRVQLDLVAERLRAHEQGEETALPAIHAFELELRAELAKRRRENALVSRSGAADHHRTSGRPMACHFAA